MKILEKDIQNACMDFLNAYKIFFWRNNTGAFKTEVGGFYRFGYPGSPDIIAIHKGKFIAIECKTKTGKQTVRQKEFEEKTTKAGGIYLLVRSSYELEEKLKKYRIIR